MVKNVFLSLLAIGFSAAVAGCSSNTDEQPTFDQQLKSADEETTPELGARKLVELSRKNRAAGIHKQSNDALRKALALVEQVDDPAARSELLLTIAPEMSPAELLQNADKISLLLQMAVNEIKDGPTRIERLASSAMLLSKMNRPDEAGSLLHAAEVRAGKTTPAPEEQAPLLIVVATAASALGKKDVADKHLADAKAVAGGVAEPQHRSLAQVRTAAALFKVGNQAEAQKLVDAALAAARAATDPQQRAEALVVVAETVHPFAKEIAAAPLISEAGVAVEGLSNAAAKDAFNQRLRTLMTPPEQSPPTP